VKKADLQAVADRKQFTRVERIINTLPAAERPEFQRYASTVLGAHTAGMLQDDPSQLDYMVQPGQLSPYQPV
jgi:hypothetical protein